MPKLPLAALGVFTVAALLAVFNFYDIVSVPSPSLLASLWFAIAGLVAYALRRRSLTTWILVSMVVGAEIGNDFPDVAIALRVLSQIFLRLIRTIVAPLIFATLVVGIAGHSNLKQVGRMGIKALIYFEVVTTIALFIGLTAINISEAGVGIKLPPPPEGETPPVAQKQTATDVILHIFPENIAKSIADGQVLQVVVFSIIFGIALALLRDDKRKQTMLGFCESLSEVMFKFTNLVMFFAPIGVGGAIA